MVYSDRKGTPALTFSHRVPLRDLAEAIINQGVDEEFIALIKEILEARKLSKEDHARVLATPLEEVHQLNYLEREAWLRENLQLRGRAFGIVISMQVPLSDLARMNLKELKDAIRKQYHSEESQSHAPVIFEAFVRYGRTNKPSAG